jgi:inorganic pyrophosphatase
VELPLDLSLLAPFDEEDGRLARVVIETPKGSRNKYVFDPKSRIFELKKVLPVGMSFPYDFGFVPSTKAEDGDPLDALVLMDEPAFPGCVLKCRLIGLIEAEQQEGRTRQRNDRIIAIEHRTHSWADIARLNDLDQEFRKELEEFFFQYNKLAGKRFHVVGHKGPTAARQAITRAMID